MSQLFSVRLLRLPEATSLYPRRATLDEGLWSVFSRAAWALEVARRNIRVRATAVEQRSTVYTRLEHTNNGIGRVDAKSLPEIEAMASASGGQVGPVTPNATGGFVRGHPAPFEVVPRRITKQDRLLYETPLYTVPGVGPENHAVDLLH